MVLSQCGFYFCQIDRCPYDMMIDLSQHRTPDLTCSLIAFRRIWEGNAQ